MPSGKPDLEVSKTSWRRPLVVLWWLALLVAAVNVLFVLRRAPILRQQNSVGDEAAVQTAARWLEHQPSDARLLLLRPHTDAAVWFNYRLNYLIYPRRHDSAWDWPPPGAESRYDLILAFGKVQPGVTSYWKPIQHVNSITLWSNGLHLMAQTGAAPDRAFRPGVAGIARAGLSVGVVFLLGCLLLGWTGSAPPFRSRLANLAVAHLIGATAMTWTVTISALVSHRLVVWPVYALILLLLPRIRKGAGIVLGSGESIPVAPDKSALNITAGGPQTVAPVVVISLALIAWLVNARLLGIGWDGYSIWQFKAQAFLNDGNMSILRDVHYIDYAHFDYPLLVPLQTWWMGLHAGGYAELWAQTTGILFTLDMAALFIAFAGRWVRGELLIVGAAILVTLPVLTTHAVSGFGDIEMACYLLALGVFISRVSICGERNQGAVLIWLFAGLVLVKNEGILAAICGLAVILAMRRRLYIQDTARCLVAACISYLPWLAFKRMWHLQNDLLQGGKNPTFTLGLAAWRMGAALRGFAQCLAQTGPRSGGWGLLVLVLPVGLVCTIWRRIGVCTPLWLLCAAQIVGYVLIYVITPHSLLQHIASSVDRLTLHLVPTLLLAALVGTCGERFEPTTRRMPES